MIFQDPLTSLNPTFTVGRQMIDVQRAHLKADRATLRSARWSCSSRSASQTPPSGWTTIRISSRAVCGNGS